MVRLRSIIAVAGLVWFVVVPAARADDSTPPAVAPTSPPAAVSTPAPASPVAATAPPVQTEPISSPVQTEPTPAPTSEPIQVSGESNPIQQITQAPAIEATPVPSPAQASEPAHLHANSSSSFSVSSQPAAPPTPTNTAQTGAPSVTGATASSPGVQASSGVTSISSFSSSPVSAAAPSQLQCSGRQWPVAAPFLSSPFAGWTDLNSFFDHDSPDYTVDGKIVIANGITALASDGTASDFFPAYWSPDLRQYINYDGHNGYDYGISYQPVYAAAAGTVSFAGWNSSDPSAGYGQMILINHHNGYVTLYGHMSKLEVSTGEKVRAGQEIGISGTTGNSTGPHLHFSVFHNCQVTDPYGWTGPGTDPLESFNGETSAYLWLPGHDPLVVNPPPHWPIFPAGLQLTVGLNTTLHARPARVVPPTDRLLLLQLPAHGRSDVSPGVALSRTVSRVDQEWEALHPYLVTLRQSGALYAYQFLPSAAAVWVSGTAAAGELESLPGVASLSGVQPVDIENAVAEFSHAVLIQIGAQQVPSLWPAGFRSALHAWRPLIALTCDQPYVSGVALPGESVNVVLRRRGKAIAQGAAITDAQSGGFLALLQENNRPVALTSGDTVTVESQTRSVTLPVSGMSIHARANAVAGTAPPDSTVLITALGRDGTEEWQRTVIAGPDGAYRLRAPDSLQPGMMAVAGTINGPGYQEAVAAYRPGMVVVEGSDEVHGWTVGRSPIFEIKRDGRTVLEARVHRAPDGSFHLDLRRLGRPVILEAGDVVSLGSIRHRQSLVLPALRAPAIEAGEALVERPVTLSLTPRPNTATLKVSSSAGQPIRISVLRRGKLLASAVALPGQRTTVLHNWLGLPAPLHAGMEVIASEDRATTTVLVPSRSASAGRVKRFVHS